MSHRVLKLYQDALEKWGIMTAVIVSIEEMAELTKLLCDWVRGKATDDNESFVERLAEEIADVEIMLGQLVTIVEAERPDYRFEEKVIDIKVAKLQRLGRLIDNAEAELGHELPRVEINKGDKGDEESESTDA